MMTPDEYAADITRLDHADDVWWDEDEDEDPWDDERPLCGCPYCFCGNHTEHGEICDDCLAGAHQG